MSLRTIEEGICNQSTRVDGLPIPRSQRLAVAIIQITRRHIITLELVRVQTLDIAPVILIEICEFVVHEYRRFQVSGDCKLENALELLGDVRHARISGIVE